MSAKQVECEGVISRWYGGKTIFMTGGTGFMGKVMLEKLLSSCPGIKKIYVLIRSKKGEDKTQRLAKIKESLIFQAIKKEHPERLDKLEALEGDIELPNLGLSTADTERMLDEVNVVFNVAATLQLNEDLRKSMIINVLATKTLLDISTSMKNLQSFVHVSTAYSNCDRKDIIEECIYPSPTDLDQLIKDCADCSDEDIDQLTSRALGNRPNTYTLTKALAENVVEGYKTKVPVAIIRPSIVTAALARPFPGWVDCKTGATGIIMAMGSGLLRIMIADRSFVPDMVPVDIIDDAIIVVAWKTASLGIRDPVVYNVTSGKNNPICLSEFIQCTVDHNKETPLDNVVWYPSVRFTTNKYMYHVGNFWMHTVPAYIYDTLVPSSSRKVQSLVKTHTIIGKAADVLEFFLTHSFKFSDNNVRLLLAEMTEEDRKMFNIDVTSINWTRYCATYVQGIRKYLLGQKDSDLMKAKQRMNIFVKAFLTGGCVWLQHDQQRYAISPRGTRFIFQLKDEQSMYSIIHKAIKLLAAGLAYYVAISVVIPYLVKEF